MGKAIRCDICHMSFRNGPTGKATNTLKIHCQRFHCRNMEVYDKATQSVLGICMRPTPRGDLSCYVEGCGYASQSGRSLESHIRNTHNDEAPITTVYNDVFTALPPVTVKTTGQRAKPTSVSAEEAEDGDEDEMLHSGGKKSGDDNDAFSKPNNNPRVTRNGPKAYAATGRIHPMFTMATQAVAESSTQHLNESATNDKFKTEVIQNLNRLDRKLDAICSILERQAKAAEQQNKLFTQLIPALIQDGQTMGSQKVSL